MSIRKTNNPALTLVAGTALAKDLLATLNASTGVADLCSATTPPLGVTSQTVLIGENQPIRMFSAGTQEITANGAITRGAAVFQAASGKISATQAAGARCIGFALDAAGADGDVIGVLPLAWIELIASAAPAALTDSTGGAAATTFAAITAGAGYAQADMVAVKNALAQVVLNLNAIRTALTAAGIAV